MPRLRTRPPKPPEYGIALGAVQRAVVTALLRGETIRVPVTAKTAGNRAPAGMSRSAWLGLRRRLAQRGYRLERGNDDYAGVMFDTYSITRLVEGSDVPVTL